MAKKTTSTDYIDITPLLPLLSYLEARNAHKLLTEEDMGDKIDEAMMQAELIEEARAGN